MSVVLQKNTQKPTIGNIMPAMSVYPVVNLGQNVPEEDGELILIDRAVADGAKLAIDLLDEAAAEDPEIAFASCWRNLRVENWDAVGNFRERIGDFLDSTKQEIPITSQEYALLEEVLTCGGEMVQASREEVGETLERVGGIVGVIGGIAGLIALTLS